MSDCVFCKIIKGELPSYRIYEDEYVYAFLDIAQDAPGHTLVVPKTHVENILDCSPETLDKVMRAVQLIAKHYVDDCGFDGVNILNCNNESAHQSVFHLHFHIIPRKKGDGMWWWAKEPKKEMDFEKICEKLKTD